MILRKICLMMAMLSIIIITGCKEEEEPVVRPTMVSTDPVSDAVDIAINSKISANFSLAMDPATITNSNFVLKQGTEIVAGTVEFSGTTATFTPSEDLAANEVFTATITTGATDVAGNAMEEPYVWSFTSGSIPDNTFPVISLTSPVDNSVEVVLNQKIVIAFSEPMDPATINEVTVKVKQGVNTVAGAVTYTDTIATFTPAANLSASQVYTITVSTGAKDMAGNALAADHIFSFTTGLAADVLLPTVILTNPLNNATGVERNKAMVVTFSEAMDSLTITTSTVILKQGATAVAGVVSYTSTTATFTPNVILEAALVYTATITTGAKDKAGNALAANTVISFTTVEAVDVTVPTVVSTNPGNSAIDVLRNKVISITFNEAMDASTITTTTFTLKQGAVAIAGTVAYSGKTATFTPASQLEQGLVYTATITTGAKDKASNALAALTEWSFTTGTTSVANLQVVNLGTSGDYVILAKTAINNGATSAVTGDLGLSPAATSYITGFALTDATGYATSSQITGKVYAADMVSPTSSNLTTAVENMITAYDDAAGRPSPDFLESFTGSIGGKTLTSGLYKWTNSVTATSDVVISGGPNEVWIFQIAGDLSFSSTVRITLEGGAQAKNIFWQVAGQTTFGTTAHFEGIILCKTGITFQTNASLNGKALAQTAVILDQNAITDLDK